MQTIRFAIAKPYVVYREQIDIINHMHAVSQTRTIYISSRRHTHTLTKKKFVKILKLKFLSKLKALYKSLFSFDRISFVTFIA